MVEEEKPKKEEPKKLGGFVINAPNALKVSNEIIAIFDKYKLSMLEITYIVEALSNTVKETEKFGNSLVSMEIAKQTLGKIMSDKQLEKDL